MMGTDSGKRTAVVWRGSITVEAAIVLPVFLCMLISIAFFLKTVRNYEIIQHSISQSAVQISQLSYLLKLSGVKDVHDTVRDGIKSSADVFTENAATFEEALGSLEIFEDGSSSLDDNASKVGRLIDSGNEMLDGPDSILKGIVSFLAGGVFEDLKTELFMPLTKLYVNKYLTAGETCSAHQKLVKMNIKDGWEGLDFNQSSFFKDKNENIEIIVRYRLDLPIPFNFFGNPSIVQRAVVKGWLNGDEVNDDLQPDEADYIWQLDNFQRGKALRKIFNANLPENFPVISGFESGKAILIKSMDLTAASYQQPQSVEDQIFEYIGRLSRYQGQEEPWGSSDIVINRDEITSKELLLVIPGNELLPAVEDILGQCVNYAASQGVFLNIQRYGKKAVKAP